MLNPSEAAKIVKKQGAVGTICLFLGLSLASLLSSCGGPAEGRKVTLENINYERESWPVLADYYSSQIIEHQAYVVSYNATYKVPNWSLYELTREETYGSLKRSNDFAPDPAVPERQMAQLEDYRGSGYDRGHMTPSGDLNWDAKVMSETYLLSNMCPQGHDFNAGTWLDLEHAVERWGRRDSAITVICGPVLPKTAEEASRMKRIGRGKVLVPEKFWKVVLSPFGDKPKAVAFLMPNYNELDASHRNNRPIREYAVTVDYLEELLDIDFFPILPDDVEERIEATFDPRDWF